MRRSPSSHVLTRLAQGCNCSALPVSTQILPRGPLSCRLSTLLTQRRHLPRTTALTTTMCCDLPVLATGCPLPSRSPRLQVSLPLLASSQSSMHHPRHSPFALPLLLVWLTIACDYILSFGCGHRRRSVGQQPSTFLPSLLPVLRRCLKRTCSMSASRPRPAVAISSLM